MVLRPLPLNCLQCQKRSVEKSKNQCKSAGKEITVKAKDRFYMSYQKVMVGNESPRFERNGSEPRDPRWRSNLGCDNSYWDVKSCSIGNEVCLYPLTYSTFRRTYRSLFAVHIPPKGNGGPGAKPPEEKSSWENFYLWAGVKIFIQSQWAKREPKTNNVALVICSTVWEVVHRFKNIFTWKRLKNELEYVRED